jgi:hypothetical protein
MKPTERLFATIEIVQEELFNSHGPHDFSGVAGFRKDPAAGGKVVSSPYRADRDPPWVGKMAN